MAFLSLKDAQDQQKKDGCEDQYGNKISYEQAAAQADAENAGNVQAGQAGAGNISGMQTEDQKAAAQFNFEAEQKKRSAKKEEGYTTKELQEKATLIKGAIEAAQEKKETDLDKALQKYQQHKNSGLITDSEFEQIKAGKTLSVSMSDGLIAKTLDPDNFLSEHNQRTIRGRIMRSKLEKLQSQRANLAVEVEKFNILMDQKIADRVKYRKDGLVSKNEDEKNNPGPEHKAWNAVKTAGVSALLLGSGLIKKTRSGISAALKKASEVIGVKDEETKEQIKKETENLVNDVENGEITTDTTLTPEFMKFIQATVTTAIQQYFEKNNDIQSQKETVESERNNEIEEETVDDGYDYESDWSDLGDEDSGLVESNTAQSQIETGEGSQNDRKGVQPDVEAQVREEAGKSSQNGQEDAQTGAEAQVREKVEEGSQNVKEDAQTGAEAQVREKVEEGSQNGQEDAQTGVEAQVREKVEEGSQNGQEDAQTGVDTQVKDDPLDGADKNSATAQMFKKAEQYKQDDTDETVNAFDNMLDETYE